MREKNEIIIHCTATPEGRIVTVPDVITMHKQRGFSTIGYHYLIGLNGEVWAGRNIEVAGAHCEGHNSKSIGIAYVGGMTKDMKEPKDTRTIAQKDALFLLVRKLKRKYNITKVSGHRDYAAKACPCFDATKEYKDI